MKYYSHHQKPVKFLTIILLVVLVLLTASIYFFFQKKETNAQPPSVQSTTVKPKVKFEQYFVPVTHFTSEKHNITVDELKSIFEGKDNLIKPIIPVEYKQEISELLNLKASTTEETAASEVISYIIKHPNTISLLPSESVDFRVKTLPVDGIFLWDKTGDFTNYPLIFRTQLTEEEASNVNQFHPAQTRDLTAVGELILSRGVAERIMHYNDTLYPFRKVNDILANADFTIATLEAPLVEECYYSRDTMTFCGEAEYIEGLTFSGIDGVSLAANHIKDYGEAGINETTALLDMNKILHTGAGKDIEEAHQPFITTLNGVTIAFLGYNDVLPTTYQATENGAGSAWANVDEIKTDIEKIRNTVDIIIIMAHWGIEYTNEPNNRQKEIAHAAIDAGADIIIGDHPHWVQGVEFYKNKFIIYGVGNFVFDQMWSQETREGTVLHLLFNDKKLVSVNFQPTIIEDYAQPRLANVEESKSILNRIWEASSFEDEP